MPTITAHYLISPNYDLTEKVKPYPNKLHHWKEAEVWQLYQNSNPWKGKDLYYLQLMKIAFLLDIASLPFNKLREDQKAVHNLIFGNPPHYSIEVFDKWWQIERIRMGGSLEYTLKKSTVKDLENLEASQIPDIDDWVQWKIKQKLDDEAKGS